MWNEQVVCRTSRCRIRRSLGLADATHSACGRVTRDHRLVRGLVDLVPVFIRCPRPLVFRLLVFRRDEWLSPVLALLLEVLVSGGLWLARHDSEREQGPCP